MTRVPLLALQIMLHERTGILERRVHISTMTLARMIQK
jgi:hypothetical protein